MTNPLHDHSPFVVVPRRLAKDWIRWLLLVAWPLSLALLWGWMTWRADPATTMLRNEHAALLAEHANQRRALEAAQQRKATLARSDQISRAANIELQETLAERDDEIATLRADVAFYERLVGATGERRALSVHGVSFQAEAGGSWRYTITLTQNLNRGAISSGTLTMALDGVVAGNLKTVDWNALHQTQNTPGQAYSFRYFQRLTGSVIVPEGFTPQRVRVSLGGGSGRSEFSVPWQASSPD